jgi:hypothetical protein
MAESEPAPEIGAIRHAEDGTLEAFDGSNWAPYKPEWDPNHPPIFKGWPGNEAPGGGAPDQAPEGRP